LFGREVLSQESGSWLGYSQYHLAVAGGCEAEALEGNDPRCAAPTRYREVVLTVSK